MLFTLNHIKTNKLLMTQNESNISLSEKNKIFYLNMYSIYSSKPLVLCYLQYFYYSSAFSQFLHRLYHPQQYHRRNHPFSKALHNVSSLSHSIHSPRLVSLPHFNYKAYNLINLVQWPTNKQQPLLKL
jgi:hypothetical protein